MCLEKAGQIFFVHVRDCLSEKFETLPCIHQVRSGMKAYAVAARRRVHLTTVLLQPRSGIAHANARPIMPIFFRSAQLSSYFLFNFPYKRSIITCEFLKELSLYRNIPLNENSFFPSLYRLVGPLKQLHFQHLSNTSGKYNFEVGGGSFLQV